MCEDKERVDESSQVYTKKTEVACMQLSIENEVGRRNVNKLDDHNDESDYSIVVEELVREKVVRNMLLALFFTGNRLLRPKPTVQRVTTTASSLTLLVFLIYL